MSTCKVKSHENTCFFKPVYAISPVPSTVLKIYEYFKCLSNEPKAGVGRRKINPFAFMEN